jgi:hypothetical protein
MGGKQVKLFLVDGTPGGLTTAEITNWTGQVVIGPRSKLADLLARDEARRTGAYLLLGDDPEAVGGIRCYVGEADELRTRLKEHNGSLRGKEFWDRVVIISSKDANPTKAHGRYLEARLIATATAAGRCELVNGTSPAPPALPEADVSDMDYFLEQLKIVLPVLGVNVLRGRQTGSTAGNSVAPASVASPEFVLTVKRTGIAARAVQVDGEFTVLAGSGAAGQVRTGAYAASTTNAYAAYRNIHQKLADDGSLRLDSNADTATFTRDVVFSSPSTAGAVVTGRSCNGREAWKTDAGLTFGAWEQQGIDSAPPSATGAPLSS